MRSCSSMFTSSMLPISKRRVSRLNWNNKNTQGQARSQAGRTRSAHAHGLWSFGEGDRPTHFWQTSGGPKNRPKSARTVVRRPPCELSEPLRGRWLGRGARHVWVGCGRTRARCGRTAFSIQLWGWARPHLCWVRPLLGWAPPDPVWVRPRFGLERSCVSVDHIGAVTTTLWPGSTAFGVVLFRPNLGWDRLSFRLGSTKFLRFRSFSGGCEGFDGVPAGFNRMLAGFDPICGGSATAGEM